MLGSNSGADGRTETLLLDLYIHSLTSEDIKCSVIVRASGVNAED